MYSHSIFIIQPLSSSLPLPCSDVTNWSWQTGCRRGVGNGFIMLTCIQIAHWGLPVCRIYGDDGNWDRCSTMLGWGIDHLTVETGCRQRLYNAHLPSALPIDCRSAEYMVMMTNNAMWHQLERSAHTDIALQRIDVMISLWWLAVYSVMLTCLQHYPLRIAGLQNIWWWWQAMWRQLTLRLRCSELTVWCRLNETLQCALQWPAVYF